MSGASGAARDRLAALPFFFDEGVRITLLDGQTAYWCRRCTLGVVMGAGSQPRCARCGALSWTAFEEDVAPQRQAWERYSAGALAAPAPAGPEFNEAHESLDLSPAGIRAIRLRAEREMQPLSWPDEQATRDIIWRLIRVVDHQEELLAARGVPAEGAT